MPNCGLKDLGREHPNAVSSFTAFKGLSITILMIIPIQGKGFINHGSGLSPLSLTACNCVVSRHRDPLENVLVRGVLLCVPPISGTFLGVWGGGDRK